MTQNDLKGTEIGPIPADWNIALIDQVAKVKGGKRLPKGHRFSDCPTSHPYIRVTDFENYTVNKSELRFVTDADYDKIKRYTISSRDVFISIAGTIGRVGMVPTDLDGANLTENAAKIVIEDPGSLLGQFLVYYLASQIGQSQIQVRATKTSQPKLALMRIKQIPILLPPLPEQRRIAHILNAIQRSIAAQDDVIAAARELKRSLMQHLFTYGPGLRPAETKETEIGEIPAHWEIALLGDILKSSGGNVQTGPFGSLLHASDYVPRGFPVVMPKDLTIRGTISSDSIACIGLDDYQRLERYHLQAKDILVARRGEIGRRGLVTERESGWLCGTGCLRIRPGHLLDSQFLAQMFEATWLREWLTVNAIGTTMLNLSARILNSMPIPLLPIQEQQEIAHILVTTDSKIAVEENRKSALEALFKSTLHQLMTGQIRLKDED